MCTSIKSTAGGVLDAKANLWLSVIYDFHFFACKANFTREL